MTDVLVAILDEIVRYRDVRMVRVSATTPLDSPDSEVAKRGYEAGVCLATASDPNRDK